jgi:hypothetical protein
MSRSGYSEDGDNTWSLIRWRGAVASAIRGKRGQAFLREALAALDAMPEKTLTTGELETDGEFCTLGVVGHARGLDLSSIDSEDWERLAGTFDISEAMAREIMWENDESFPYDYDWVEIPGPLRPAEYRGSMRVVRADARHRRWQHMRDWIVRHLRGQGESQ